MAEHLQIRVHIASVALINQAIVIRNVLDSLFDIQDNKNIRINLLCFNFDNLKVRLRV